MQVIYAHIGKRMNEGSSLTKRGLFQCSNKRFHFIYYFVEKCVCMIRIFCVSKSFSCTQIPLTKREKFIVFTLVPEVPKKRNFLASNNKKKKQIQFSFRRTHRENLYILWFLFCKPEKHFSWNNQC